MLDIFFLLIGFLYSIVVILLFAFGLNFYYLTFLSIRSKPKLEPDQPPTLPKVTVQLPVYNELYVVERLIEAACNLDYPHDVLEIQVLDDSTDETTQVIKRTVDKLSARGIRIVHLHRTDRTGYKAGALAAGMAQAHGEFLAIFDADFVPNPDFLKRTIPFFHDPKIAFLQTRWSHLNREYSFLTYLQSLFIDAHFMIEQTGRSDGGYWFNFNGTAGVWRKSAIEDVGGWKATTLTEDLDLSYRVFLKDWQAVYLRDVDVPAELPVTITAFRRQQYRWARGSLEVAQKYLSKVFQAPISARKKLEAGLHLTGYCLHILLFAVSLLYPLVLAMSLRYPDLIPLFRFASFFNIGVFAQTIFFLSAQHQLKRSWWKTLPAIAFATALGAGMMLNTVQAALHIFIKKRVGFERTPKYGIGRKERGWKHKRYQLNLDRIVFFELIFAGFNAWTTYYALQHQNLIIAAYAATFCGGFLLTSILSIQQTLTLALQRRKSTSPSPQLMDIPQYTPNPNREENELVKTVRDRVVPAESSRLETAWTAIQKTIAYSDIFDYPLTALEIHRYLIGVSETADCIQGILDEKLSSRQVGFRDGYYTLPEREYIVSKRRRRQIVAEELWQKAFTFGKLISRMPFVRMVAVTGALAMNNVDKGADIDFLIVTKPDRLWLCRGLVIFLVRWARMRGVTLCPNYIISERALIFPDRTVYTAHELVQMVPLFGIETYCLMLRLNDWTDEFLPNARRSLNYMATPELRSSHLSKSIFERILLTSLGTRLELWERERKIRKFGSVQPDSQEVGFSADWCKGHFHHHAQQTVEMYTSRLKLIRTEGTVNPEYERNSDRSVLLP